MKDTKTQKIALVGNPNIGKTTLFNSLCGLTQKTGNYPGVTIDKKIGEFKANGVDYKVIDLPGINSLYPKSKDEELVIKYLSDSNASDYPDKIIVIVSALNIKRTLYLFHQIRDLNIPVILAINMTDVSEKRGIFIDAEKLQKYVGCPVVKISAKRKEGIEELKKTLESDVDLKTLPQNYSEILSEADLSELTEKYSKHSNYHTFLSITNKELDVAVFLKEKETTVQRLKITESVLRYKYINSYLPNVLRVDKTKATDFTTNADKVLLHPFWGYVVFVLILFSIFQTLFVVAAYPMEWIDQGSSFVATLLKSWLPEGWASDLLTDGILPGIGGVVMFIPQIALLFLFFSILEESGYMSRIVFLLDQMMQRFGMSGKSVVPLMSSFACAIPGILATRSIENKKERLITIMVSPLLTCSARLPVYVILISIAVPDTYFGPINLQGIAMLGMYFIGIISTLVAALIFKLFIKGKYTSTLLLEMPQYLMPSLKNTLIRIWENTSSFVFNAGKIILASSIILFVLATTGGKNFADAATIVKADYPALSKAELDLKISSYQLEHSYLGGLGKGIEPVIAPLGYDWKIGIALISSLAAREVFVSTISTIYSIDSESSLTIKEKLQKEVDVKTGKPVFSLATAFSLLLFYAFSLQCLSTVAVTYKETQSIKWTVTQFLYMSIFAYIVALATYQLLT